MGGESSYTYVDMMKGKGYAPSALRNFIRDVAGPAYILTDNAYEEVLGEWEEVCISLIVYPRSPLNLIINIRTRLREEFRTLRREQDF